MLAIWQEVVEVPSGDVKQAWNKVWKKVTPIPPEYNGHTYLFECRVCGYSTVWLGKGEYPPYKCPKCGNGEVAE